MTDPATFNTYVEAPGDLVDHPLVLGLGNGERLGALGLYCTVGDWASRHSPDTGLVPEALVQRYDSRGRVAQALVDAGLWTYGDNGYRFTYWHKPDALITHVG